MGNKGYLPLFETKKPRGIAAYRLFAASIFVGISSIWVYRVIYIPREGENGRWIWIGLFVAELWFGFYWFLTQALRWNPVFRSSFKDRLSQRCGQELPSVDIFVCTADPKIEPPMMVFNTVLSVMSYDYPPEKLAVYLSDDGGSDVTFYALLEAAKFSQHWLPFCNEFNVEPRSPAAYFASISDSRQTKEIGLIKEMYKDIENRIESAANSSRLPEEVRLTNRGFAQWDSYSSPRDHDTILQILVDRNDPNARDVKGCSLPTLVYLAREKRPQHFHNFKAGALNSLIRVSSEISNGQIILTLDCDMYSNNSKSIRDALCFFLDEEKGHEIAFVQFPQNFDNITKNDLYGSSLRLISELEFHGLDGFGGPLYVGTGCFHRRDTLYGRKFNKKDKNNLKIENDAHRKQDFSSLPNSIEKLKSLASCTYEQNTSWGKEMGLRYGCPVEDVMTGLAMHCNGWKSVYFNPERKGFLGVAATTLAQILVQHKRWSEGDFQILLSKYSPAWYANGKINLGQQLGYLCYCLWCANSLPTLFYSIFPSLYLLRGISLFPQISSIWFIPFAYVIVSKYICSLAEFLWSNGTVKGWWNEQRIWLYKRTSSYFLAFIDTILKSFGFSDSAFVITAKVSDEDVSMRFSNEIMEFGASTPMFTMLATVALINLFCLIGMMKNVGVSGEPIMVLQILLCSFLVLVNFPLYEGLFLRKDNGKMPFSITVKSTVFALSTCTCFAFLY